MANVIEQHGKFLMGDVDTTSDRRHHYDQTKVTGYGKAIGGDISADAMEKFFQ